MTAVIQSIHGFSNDQMLTLAHCRGLKQYTETVEGYLAGKCPFCDPLGEENEVVLKNDSWQLWRNPFPHKHTQLHLVLAPRRHLTTVDQIAAFDFGYIGDLFTRACVEFGIPGGGLAMRFGSPMYTSASALHLHANIVVPDGTGPVEATFAKESSKAAIGFERIPVFEKLRTGTEVASLTSVEFGLIKGRV